MRGKHKIKYIIDETNKVSIAVVEKDDVVKEFGVVEDAYFEDQFNLNFRRRHKKYGNCTSQFKAITRCNDSDTFDAKLGKEIVKSKLYLQVFKYKRRLIDAEIRRIKEDLDKLIEENKHNEEQIESLNKYLFVCRNKNV